MEASYLGLLIHSVILSVHITEIKLK